MKAMEVKNGDELSFYHYRKQRLLILVILRIVTRVFLFYPIFEVSFIPQFPFVIPIDWIRFLLRESMPNKFLLREIVSKKIPAFPTGFLLRKIIPNKIPA